MQFFSRMMLEGGRWMYPILILGGLATLGSLAGLVVALIKKSRAAHLGFGLGSLAAGLVTLGLGWLGYTGNQSLIKAALANTTGQTRLALMLKGNAENAWNVSLSLWLSVLPLIGGVFLLVRGFMLKPSGEIQPQGRASLAVATLCGAAGLGLILAGLLDYLGYDDFFICFLVF